MRLRSVALAGTGVLGVLYATLLRPRILTWGATDAEARALGLGAVATLTKPLDVDALLRVVRRYCAPSPPKRDLALDRVSGTGAARRGP